MIYKAYRDIYVLIRYQHRSREYRCAEDRAARPLGGRGAPEGPAGDRRPQRVSLPASTETEFAALYQFRDFAHFLELWLMTTSALQTERDFRQVVVDYATEAASHGAVYLEGIFTPVERVGGGASWDEVVTGFCDGAAEATEKTGVEVRLTPDIPRNLGPEVAVETARYAIKYRERGVVGAAFLAGLAGALCDEGTRARLRAIADSTIW
jgi:aminodeoxyfutalosine deaminase